MLYKNNRKPLLYFLTVFCLVVALGGSYFIIKNRIELINEVESKVLGNLLFAVLLLCCNVFLVIMIWYQSKYILQIWQKKDIGIVEIKTWSWFNKNQWNSYPVTIFETKEYWAGAFDLNGSSGQTPVTWLKTPDGKKLILDHQAEFLNGFEETIFDS